MNTTTPLRTEEESRAALVRVVRLLIALLLSLLVYLMMGTSSKGKSSGGFSDDGSFVDSQGNPTSEPPRSVMLVLGPSFSFLLLALLIVIVGVWIASRAMTSQRADQILKSTVAVIVGFTMVAIIAMYAGFGRLEISDDMENGESISVPFGRVSVTVKDDLP
ncbi:hypothetical protein U6G28_01045 [Actinomycetaceae bacterium MB13-C1-2]|nr:hypothetical protein U6G28_01045 [Actinomycetaceae bacterium MB13-C1-2]